MRGQNTHLVLVLVLLATVFLTSIACSEMAPCGLEHPTSKLDVSFTQPISEPGTYTLSLAIIPGEEDHYTLTIDPGPEEHVYATQQHRSGISGAVNDRGNPYDSLLEQWSVRGTWREGALMGLSFVDYQDMYPHVRIEREGHVILHEQFVPDYIRQNPDSRCNDAYNIGELTVTTEPWDD